MQSASTMARIRTQSAQDAQDRERDLIHSQALADARSTFRMLRRMKSRELYPLSQQNAQNGICTFGESFEGNAQARADHWKAQGASTPASIVAYLNWLSDKVHAGTLHTIEGLGK